MAKTNTVDSIREVIATLPNEDFFAFAQTIPRLVIQDPSNLPSYARLFFNEHNKRSEDLFNFLFPEVPLDDNPLITLGKMSSLAQMSLLIMASSPKMQKDNIKGNIDFLVKTLEITTLISSIITDSIKAKSSGDTYDYTKFPNIISEFIASQQNITQIPAEKDEDLSVLEMQFETALHGLTDKELIDYAHTLNEFIGMKYTCLEKKSINAEKLKEVILKCKSEFEQRISDASSLVQKITEVKEILTKLRLEKDIFLRKIDNINTFLHDKTDEHAEGELPLCHKNEILFLPDNPILACKQIMLEFWVDEMNGKARPNSEKEIDDFKQKLQKLNNSFDVLILYIEGNDVSEHFDPGASFGEIVHEDLVGMPQSIEYPAETETYSLSLSTIWSYGLQLIGIAPNVVTGDSSTEVTHVGTDAET